MSCEWQNRQMPENGCFCYVNGRRQGHVTTISTHEAGPRFWVANLALQRVGGQRARPGSGVCDCAVRCLRSPERLFAYQIIKVASSASRRQTTQRTSNALGIDLAGEKTGSKRIATKRPKARKSWPTKNPFRRRW